MRRALILFFIAGCGSSSPSNTTLGQSCNSDADCYRDQLCNAGRCDALMCIPGEVECVSNAVIACSSDGLELTVLEVCTTTCSEFSAACVEAQCQPLATSCVGDDLHQCNSSGTGTQFVTTCGTGCLAGGCLGAPPQLAFVSPRIGIETGGPTIRLVGSAHGIV